MTTPNSLPTERHGMKLVDTFVKRMPNGKTVTMARIKCACGGPIVTPVSRWRRCLFNCCKKCALAKNKRDGFGLFGDGKNLKRLPQ